MSKSGWRITIVPLLLLGMTFPGVAPFAKSSVTEERIKAAYLYQFSNFIKWPEHATNSDNQFQICILGDHPVQQALAPIQRRKKKYDTIRVRDVELLSNLPSCHILYIGNEKEHLLPEIKTILNGQPVLTVSGMSKFAEIGGIIGFVLKDGNIKIEINTSEAKSAGLTISAKLLEVSYRVLNHEIPGGQ